MDKADWGDSEYIIWHELWSNVNSPFWDERTIPITATFVRAGVFSATLVQDDNQAMFSSDPGVAEGGTHVHGVIAKVTIAGGTYTISDVNGDELISGKIVDGKMKTPRPAFLNNKVANSTKSLKK